MLAQGECGGGTVELGSTRLLAEASVVIPAVSKPLHARLEAALPTSDKTVRNAWDLWLFPKRDKQDGRGIAVSKDLLPALEKLYAGLAPAGSPEAESATLLISRLCA